jgi:hypothetical protein
VFESILFLGKELSVLLNLQQQPPPPPPLLLLLLIIIKLNSYLLMPKLNTTEANYKISTSKEYK